MYKVEVTYLIKEHSGSGWKGSWSRRLKDVKVTSRKAISIKDELIDCESKNSHRGWLDQSSKKTLYKATLQYNTLLDDVIEIEAIFKVYNDAVEPAISRDDNEVIKIRILSEAIDNFVAIVLEPLEFLMFKDIKIYKGDRELPIKLISPAPFAWQDFLPLFK